MGKHQNEPWYVSKEEVLLVECPKCLQPPGLGCVYVAPKLHVNYEHGPMFLAALKRTGTLTKVSHIERYTAARDKLRTGHVRRPGRTGIRAPEERLAISKAERDWDLSQHLALREWLVHHGDIFTRTE